MSRKVLVADNDRAYAEMVCTVLQAAGWDCVAERPTSGLAAANVVASHPRGYIASAVLDFDMPPIGGIGAARIIRQYDPNVHVVIVTGHEWVVEEVRTGHLGEGSGISGVVLKGTASFPDDLLSMIGHALGPSEA